MNMMCSMLCLTVLLQTSASVFEIHLSPGEGVPDFKAALKIGGKSGKSGTVSNSDIETEWNF
jgi:hypothetical protein